MSNITEQYRKPLMSDETGKAIAQKLGGDSVESESESVNISEQYRKPLMSEETAQAILEKIDGGSGSGNFVVNVTEDENGNISADKTVNQISQAIQDGKLVYATLNSENLSYFPNQIFDYIPLNHFVHNNVNQNYCSFKTDFVSDTVNNCVEIHMSSNIPIVIHEYSYVTEMIR